MPIKKLKLVAGFLILGLASCATQAEPFKVRLSWKLKGEYAPLYIAQELGFYAQNNLTVTIGEGAGAQAALAAVLQGQEDAAIVPGAFALSAISKGMGVKIVALYQPRAPVGLISLASNPIRTPKDMEGKKIATSVGDTVGAYIKVVCVANKLDCAKIDRVLMDSKTRSTQLFAGRVDAVTTYLNVEPPSIELGTNEKIALLDFSKFGVVLPGLSVVVKDDAVAKRPKAIAGFLIAIDKGIAASRKDPGAAAEALRKAWAAAPSSAVVRRQVEITLDSIPAATQHPSGWVDADELKVALEMLQSVGEVQDVKPLETYYSNVLFAPSKSTP